MGGSVAPFMLPASCCGRHANMTQASHRESQIGKGLNPTSGRLKVKYDKPGPGGPEFEGPEPGNWKPASSCFLSSWSGG